MPDSFASLLTLFVIPQNLCLALLGLAVLCLLLRLRRTASLFAMAGLTWVLAWSLPATSIWLGGILENAYPPADPQQTAQADAIIVLGGNTANNRRNWFLAYDKDTAISRLDTAEMLYKSGKAPLLLLSGGALEGHVSEAQGLAYQLRQRGIPEQAMILENESRNTYENALYSKRFMEQHGLNTALLVTSALHMPRSIAVFTQQGMHVFPAGNPGQIYLSDTENGLSKWLPNLRALEASRSILKEYIGLAVYRLRGWI